MLEENVSGDFIETGIWRGGACIFMRGVLKAYDVNDRTVWCADSFDGVPEPSWPQWLIGRASEVFRGVV